MMNACFNLMRTFRLQGMIVTLGGAPYTSAATAW
jgi:hypothetical protein